MSRIFRGDGAGGLEVIGSQRHRRAQVTFGLAAYNIAAHVYPALAMPFSLGQVCFSTGAFWAAWCARDLVEVAVRTFGSVFTHADDMHLYWNMGSLLVKGVPVSYTHLTLPTKRIV